MTNSNFETSMKGAGQAIDETAKETGRQATGVYEQAKNAASSAASQAKSAASEAYDSASELAQDAVTRVQDTASDIDDMVSEEVGRHPKAMVALSIGVGFALGMLFASLRSAPEPRWYDRIRS